jgi:hypothetical protein
VLVAFLACALATPTGLRAAPAASPARRAPAVVRGAASPAPRPAPAPRARPAATVSPREAARRRYLDGERHFRAGQFLQALRAYEEGYRLAALPGFLINIARCHHRLGDDARAAAAFRAYLLAAPTSRRRPEVERALAALESRRPPGGGAATFASVAAPTRPGGAPPAAAVLPPPPAGVRGRPRPATLAALHAPPPALTAAPAPPPDVPEPRSYRPLVIGAVAGVVAGLAVSFLVTRSRSSAGEGVRHGTIGTLSR